MVIEVKDMNILQDVPDMFDDIFQYYWVFVVVLVVVSVVGVACITGIILFFVFKVFRKSGQMIDKQMDLHEKAVSQKECEFCGGAIPGLATECPNCGAPAKANE